MSSYSAEQEKTVLKILSYKPHQYYEILECEKTASDSLIKKSYRKLAVRLHPDKNPHPRASEAFKYLNKAWGVLSDPSKKRIFDQTGSDPDSRFSGYSNSSSSGGQASGVPRGFGGGGGGVPRGFEDDIFNMFFGGGGAPGGTTFTFGGNNGFTFQSFGNGFDPFGGNFAQQQRQRQRQRQSQSQSQSNKAEQSQWDTLRQMAPLLLILFATLLSSIFSGDSSPDYSFTKNGKYSIRRVTPTFEIPYYVRESLISENNKRALHKFDEKVEKQFIQDKRTACSRETFRQNEMMQEAQGWFFTDEKKMEKARNMDMPACSTLKDMGLL